MLEKCRQPVPQKIIGSPLSDFGRSGEIENRLLLNSGGTDVMSTLLLWLVTQQKLSCVNWDTSGSFHRKRRWTSMECGEGNKGGARFCTWKRLWNAIEISRTSVKQMLSDTTTQAVSSFRFCAWKRLWNAFEISRTSVKQMLADNSYTSWHQVFEKNQKIEASSPFDRD